MKYAPFNNSVVKAFRIIELIENEMQGIGLKDISERLNYNKTTTLRFLTTLENLGVIRKRDGKYFLGLKLFELGLKVPFKMIVVDKVHNILEKLVNEINETVNFGVLLEGKVLYIDKIESKRSLQINTHIGDKISLHCTALGKSIFSILPENQVDSILEKIRLEKKTDNTIVKKEELLEEIKKTKERGYSIDNEEFEEGLRCVAVPIKLEKIGFYGAISVSGPVTRFTENAISELAKKLKKIKEKILKEVQM